MKKPVLKWFKNISIKRKLYFVVGIMALLIAVELFTLWFAVKTLSSVRAYVGGEGLWSKAQKDAGYYLLKYGHTRNEQDYVKFNEFLKVPLGDAKARMELTRPVPDLELARQGFIEGHNHPEDVNGMIWLFRTFNEISYIERAIAIWGEAEPLMNELLPISKRLHDRINSPNVSDREINNILAEIDPINQKLTRLEDEFSFTLGEGSRWLESLILKILFLMALTVEFTGLLLTISVSINISRSIQEIVLVSDRVGKADFSKRAKVFSKDEIGQLALSFNQMVSDLEQRILERDAAQNNLHEQKKKLEENALKLEQSNKDLEQFAYVASHDLREPLRTISSYVQLLDKRYRHKLDKDANEFIDFVVSETARMNNLIADLLTYAQVGKRTVAYEAVDTRAVIDSVLAASAEGINTSGAVVTTDEKMPVICAGKQGIMQIFQNLVNNAIKFCNTVPCIHISARDTATHWLFSVRDNGIGIDMKYADKVFVIFQRLNPREKYEGTGIGLTICKKIVDQHEGSIWVDSEPGKGSTFNFTIKKVKENG